MFFLDGLDAVEDVEEGILQSLGMPVVIALVLKASNGNRI
jgi:hypothetical protein